MPRRQPRCPSMGLISAAPRPRCDDVGRPPSVAASSLRSRRSVGRNSCSGGSSRRMVTGSPSMAVKMPTKSSRCKGSSFAAASRVLASSARIMRRTASMRSPSKNMCSVRHRPMPSAPNSRRVLASSGVSALVRTLRRRDFVGPGHELVAKSPEMRPASSSTWPRMTSPVVPSRRQPVALVSVCRRAQRRLLRSRSPARSSPPRSLAHAARDDRRVDVMPPRAVRMPSAACMPPTSSGRSRCAPGSPSRPAVELLRLSA